MSTYCQIQIQTVSLTCLNAANSPPESCSEIARKDLLLCDVSVFFFHIEPRHVLIFCLKGSPQKNIHHFNALPAHDPPKIPETCTFRPHITLMFPTPALKCAWRWRYTVVHNTFRLVCSSNETMLMNDHFSTLFLKSKMHHWLWWDVIRLCLPLV